MTKLEIGFGGLKEAAAEFLRVAKALEKRRRVSTRDRLHFADMPTLLKNLTGERWRVVEFVRANGPLSIYAVARRLGRNYKNVHADVNRLLELGLLEKQDDGRLVVPYRSIVAEIKLAA
ncbi:MAG: MarR family transcriptional regulator [Betaproteobacteria bacterium]|nr:MarR family transcriptional regulator [Betaproteobacteria bacterium]